MPQRSVIETARVACLAVNSAAWLSLSCDQRGSHRLLRVAEGLVRSAVVTLASEQLAQLVGPERGGLPTSPRRPRWPRGRRAKHVAAENKESAEMDNPNQVQPVSMGSVVSIL